jgi:hypothetical protein
MKIYELVEQTVGTVPPGAGAPLSPTQPTIPSTTNTANTGTGATQQMGQPPQNMSNIKNNINNLKGLLGAAGATGTIDTNKIAGAMNDPKQAMSPNVMQALQGLLPGLADALQNNQAAGQIKSAIKTGVDAQQKIQQVQQAANDPQYQKVAESLKRLVESLKKLK